MLINDAMATLLAESTEARLNRENKYLRQLVAILIARLGGEVEIAHAELVRTPEYMATTELPELAAVKYKVWS